MQTAFVVDDTHKDFIVREAGKLHRAFRSHIATKYLKDDNGNINDHPPRKYARYISEEQWRVFKAKQTSASAQVTFFLIILNVMVGLINYFT